MKFPWEKYEELPVRRINTLQMFITTHCNLNCTGCFVRGIMGEKKHMELDEYKSAIKDAANRGVQRITLIGGEPLLHPDIKEMIQFNNWFGLKTTIYTNGYFLGNFSKADLQGAKIRVSIYCETGKTKSLNDLPKTADIPFDVCFMVSKNSTVKELLKTADYLEIVYFCKVFFISSLRELDNPSQEFFEDTDLTMPVLEYKKLVHDFLNSYSGEMEIHVSKRGVFESTINQCGNKCKFANYFIGGKIIQCPYDIANQKYQRYYSYETRYCQHNNSCLMSKIALKQK